VKASFMLFFVTLLAGNLLLHLIDTVHLLSLDRMSVGSIMLHASGAMHEVASLSLMASMRSALLLNLSLAVSCTHVRSMSRICPP